MAIVWVQQDGPQRMRELLRQVMGKSWEKRVRAAMPEKWTPADGPVVTVVGDGTPVAQAAWSKEAVRVTVRAESLPRARRILSEIDAYLVTPGFRGGLGVSAGAGIIALPDSKSGGFMASATYSVTLPKQMKGIEL